jgi:hypothetical protein
LKPYVDALHLDMVTAFTTRGEALTTSIYPTGSPGLTSGPPSIQSVFAHPLLKIAQAIIAAPNIPFPIKALQYLFEV